MYGIMLKFTDYFLKEGVMNDGDALVYAYLFVVRVTEKLSIGPQ
jgi:hypothetical protein